MKSCTEKRTSMLEPYIVNNLFVEDERGSFSKCYLKDMFENLGIEFDCSEIFYSISKKGVIRGMHFQTHMPQAKFVTVVKGGVYDVVVDLRRNSENFGKWYAFDLSDSNHCSLYIPEGFAHGFQALEDENVMLYMCHGPYDKETDTGIKYNDLTLSIDWRQSDECIVGKRDQELMSLEDFIQVVGGL